MIWITLCVLVFYVNEIFAAFSGLYVDNEEGKTVRKKFDSAQDEFFERNMLEFLGLRRKPQKIYRPSELEISATKFLLNIYNAFDKDKLDDEHDEFNFKIEDMKSVQESDTIMAFLARNDRENDTRYEKDGRLWFDVEDIRVGDTILNAELRLYKFCNNEITNEYTVTVHNVLETLNGDQHLEYVDAVNVTRNYEGWMVFNVSSSLTKWVIFPSTNRGLYLSVHEHSNSSHKIEPGNIGIISSTSRDENQQPFVVVYLKSGKVNIRRRRDVAPSKRYNKQKTRSSSNSNDPFSSESNGEMRSCQLQTLYVNFKDFNWTDWIISPPGYAAHYCSGTCEFPLGEETNTTNHAIMQTLMKVIEAGSHNETIPPACCVPTKLTSIKVLHYTRDETAVLKTFPEMIAKSCACR